MQISQLVKDNKGLLIEYIMRLSANDLEYIMGQFPNIKLSYEKTIHKKVSSATFFLTIPKGKKYFAWFRYFKYTATCFLLELDRRRQNITSIVIKTCSFCESLCTGLGTILYGTLFNCDKRNFYNIEDIFYLKGQSIQNSSQLIKIDYFRQIFGKYIRQIVLGKQDIFFGLPIISNTRMALIKQTKELPYELYAIQHRCLKAHHTYLNERIVCEEPLQKIFLVQATIKDDIYILYCKQGEVLIQCGFPIIQDYKTSVFMNTLFRNIKENANLDKLEESDDEEEFENIQEDKFVDLTKKCNILCVYLTKFQLWKPMKYIKKGVVCDRKELLRLEKYNRR